MSFGGRRETGSRAEAVPATGKTILVAEASAFSRGLIRSGLDMAGYQVLEAANLDEAIRRLGAATGGCRGGGARSSAQRRFRSAGRHAPRPEWEESRSWSLAESAEQGRGRPRRTHGIFRIAR